MGSLHGVLTVCWTKNSTRGSGACGGWRRFSRMRRSDGSGTASSATTLPPAVARHAPEAGRAHGELPGGAGGREPRQAFFAGVLLGGGGRPCPRRDYEDQFDRAMEAPGAGTAAARGVSAGGWSRESFFMFLSKRNSRTRNGSMPNFEPPNLQGKSIEHARPDNNWEKPDSHWRIENVIYYSVSDGFQDHLRGLTYG